MAEGGVGEVSERPALKLASLEVGAYAWPVLNDTVPTVDVGYEPHFV